MGLSLLSSYIDLEFAAGASVVKGTVVFGVRSGSSIVADKLTVSSVIFSGILNSFVACSNPERPDFLIPKETVLPAGACIYCRHSPKESVTSTLRLCNKIFAPAVGFLLR